MHLEDRYSRGTPLIDQIKINFKYEKDLSITASLSSSSEFDDIRQQKLTVQKLSNKHLINASNHYFGVVSGRSIKTESGRAIAGVKNSPVRCMI